MSSITRMLPSVWEDNGEIGDGIEGTVLAGRVYCATMSMHWRDGLRFLALNPRSRDDRWSQREQFLAETPLLELDPALVPLVQQDLGDVAGLIRDAEANYQEPTPEEREERVIRPEDGI